MSEQLAEALRSQATRVMDLFRQWDRDGDGEVSRAEFHKAIPALGLSVSKADIDILFNEWDRDGGGALNYKELKKILSGQSTKKSSASIGGAAKTSLTAASLATKAASSLGQTKSSAPAPANAP